MIPLLLLLSLAALVASDPCYDFIRRMHDRRMTGNYRGLTKEESYFLDYSGTNEWIPAFGNKRLCNEAPEMKYMVAIRSTRRVDYEVWSSIAYGVCLPKICASVPHLSKNQIEVLFLSRGWYLAAYHDYAKYYRLEDPENWVKPPLYYPAIALFVLFTLAAVVSSAYLCVKRLKGGQLKGWQPGPHLQGIMEAFDLNKNTLQLYQTAKEQKTNEDLAIFHFLRTLSAYWVVHFHTALYNKIFCIAWREDRNYVASAGGPLFWLESADAVNNFFFMGGFFAVYTLVTKLASAPFGFKVFFEQLKHRILRIWPVYMILLLLYSQIGPYFWPGPGMYLYQSEASPCHNGQEILAKMFFMDGLLNKYITPTTGGLCWGSTWYIASEFHIYWFAIIVIGVYARYRRTGRTLMVILIFQAGLLAHTRYAIYNNFLGEYARLWESKHIRTPCTLWYTFFTGAFWGALYHEYSRLKRKNIFSAFEKYPVFSYITMAVGVFLSFDIRANYFFIWPKLTTIAFPVFRSFVYDTSVSLIYMPLLAKRPSAIKRFMTKRFFQIAGKTSFVVYLVHDFVFRTVLMNTAEMRTYNYVDFTRYAFAAIFISQMLGFWVHLCIEKPLTNLEVYLTKKKKSSQGQPRVEVKFGKLSTEEPK